MLGVAAIIYLSAAGVILQLVLNWLRLRHIPGPFLAGCTDLWRLLVVWSRKSEETYLQLHEKYGDVVRIGPNAVSVSGPESDIPRSIYGIGKGFVKSDFYFAFQNVVNGRRVASLVSMTDESQHSATKRPIAPAYSLSTLIEFEPLVDSTIAVFLSRLDEFEKDHGVVDLGQWLQFFSFDVIGELTFSRRLGFLENGTDVEGIMGSIAANFDRTSVIGQMPWIDLVTYKNPIYLKFFEKPISSPVMSFGHRRLLERLNQDTEPEKETTTIADPELRAKNLEGTKQSKPDFLSRFLKAREEAEDTINDKKLLGYLFMNVNAGSDTVAVILRATFYYLLKNPESLSKLITELEGAKGKGLLSTPFVTYAEASALPYLSAVIKEAIRMHPALALPLERVVPHSGLQLQDKNKTYLPPSTVVGANPWVLHRDTRIFGADAARWNPDRWLKADEAQVKLMEHNILTFGAGKRTCLGKNIAMLELHKVVPTLLMRYNMELAEPDMEWRTINSWLIRQEGLNVILSRR